MLGTYWWHLHSSTFDMTCFKCTVLCSMQDLCDIYKFILWQIEVMCSHHHTYTQQKGKCCMFWAQADRRLSQRMRMRLRGGLTATPITTPFWMIGSGSSAPQPSAKTQPFLCVTPISCTHMMRDGGVCHHLYHSTQMKPQPWWIQGVSYPTALYGETNELFSSCVVNRKYCRQQT